MNDNNKDKVILSNGYLYVYCPVCDEIHSVPMWPDHNDGWRFVPINFGSPHRRHFRPPEGMSDNPSSLEFPHLDHCAHSISQKYRTCIWQLAGYFDTSPEGIALDKKLNGSDRLQIRYLVPSLGYIGSSGHGKDGYSKLRTVKEWPEKFQTLVKSLTKTDAKES